MAVLSNEIKTFIVQALACFDTPSQVAEEVKKEFGVEISRQQVETHNPTKVAGKGLAKKWVDIFHATRERFRSDITSIPIANRAYRLRALQRMAEKAETMRNMPLAAQLHEQAAKEAGDMYTNRQKIDHTSSDGSMTPKAAVELSDEQLAAIAASGHKG